LALAHPVPAILLYRRMADAVLARSLSAYYDYAVLDLTAAERLSAGVTDWLGQLSQDDYRGEIANRHRQKSAFWKRMNAAGLDWRA
jgi:hypothetical protein